MSDSQTDSVRIETIADGMDDQMDVKITIVNIGDEGSGVVKIEYTSGGESLTLRRHMLFKIAEEVASDGREALHGR